MVHLSIFDLLGCEVATLVNRPQNPGVYEFTFLGAGLPSGNYYYRLQYKDETITKKMSLLK